MISRCGKSVYNDYPALRETQCRVVIRHWIVQIANLAYEKCCNLIMWLACDYHVTATCFSRSYSFDRPNKHLLAWAQERKQLTPTLTRGKTIRTVACGVKLFNNIKAIWSGLPDPNTYLVRQCHEGGEVQACTTPPRILTKQPGRC